MPKIALDAMGSDNYPEPEIRAAIEAANLFREEVLLTGPEEVLGPKLAALNAKNVRIVHAPEVFEMTDKISPGIIRKARNSMAVGMKLLKSGEVDAFVTMGNTSGALAHSQILLGRIRGIKRAALTVLFPVKNGKCVVLDVGANVECKPAFLLQFAMMGSMYAQAVLGIDNPRVGLFSIGEEAGKGNDLVKATYPLLETSNLNFIGNVESKELFGGEVGVVVTDGFTGNILLKSSEAVARLMIDVLREQMAATFRTKIGAFLAKPAFGVLKNMLDPAKTGAGSLLGIDGLVFLGHGRSRTRAVVSAIRTARQAVDADLLSSIRTANEERLKSLKREATT